LKLAQTLGICVATKNALDHVFGLATAARAAGKEVQVFLTGEGVLLTQMPRFSELLETASVKVCEVSYMSNGLQGVETPGLAYKDFVTQGRNAEMVEECDRYLVL